MSFRDARADDLRFVLDGLADNRRIEGRSPEAAACTDADEAEYAARIAAGTVRILEIDGQPAAFLSYALDFEVMYVAGAFLWIDLVYVRASMRGRGLGKRLYVEAARLARQSGCAKVVADVFSANEGSVAFHERVGFTPLYTIFEREV